LGTIFQAPSALFLFKNMGSMETLLKEQIKTIAEQRDAVEEILKIHSARLQAAGVGLKDPLVDAEVGYDRLAFFYKQPCFSARSESDHPFSAGDLRRNKPFSLSSRGIHAQTSMSQRCEPTETGSSS
jgi:hypothetical protein